MQATVTWEGGKKFLGATESGHEVLMDGAPHAGGENRGPRPMEMVLLGLGGCTAFDVVHILERGRHALGECRIRLEAERAEIDPKVFTRIHMHFIVSGAGLTEKAVGRAVELSAEKYCSVARMLASTATITHDWELRSGD